MKKKNIIKVRSISLKCFFKLLLNNKVINNWDDFFGIVISIVPDNFTPSTGLYCRDYSINCTTKRYKRSKRSKL